jgi:glutathione synthase/RimK-type ligase-like ATP-grasp enzyme
MPSRVITDNKSLAADYEKLNPGDIVVGRIRLQTGEEHVLLDLLARGITLVPSAVSQLCSRSKVFQVRILRRYMIPGTEAVYSMHDMMRIVSAYGRNNFGKVVCKLDRANGGLGILLYSSIEDVYSQAVLGTLRFPFVVQPYIDGCRDVRGVFLGEYTEAYTRFNPDNFRHNMHCGGHSAPWKMQEDQVHLCREVMARADFPYACIDLLITPAGETWVNEINLRGGLRGARISQSDYLLAVDKIHSALLGRQPE